MRPSDLLSEPLVRYALKQAWLDSHPGVFGAHEEGGFVVREASGGLNVVRWPQGEQNTIVLPPHRDCRIPLGAIVASFHTHPNTGYDFLQEPSETDTRAIRDDPDLKGSDYAGEWVITEQILYLISPAGEVSEVADSQELFSTT